MYPLFWLCYNQFYQSFCMFNLLDYAFTMPLRPLFAFDRLICEQVLQFKYLILIILPYLFNKKIRKSDKSLFLDDMLPTQLEILLFGY